MEFKNNTPYAPEFDDIYFSPDDGIAETKHVFINGNRIIERFSALMPQQIFTIAETGFGTGLNFLTTAQEFLNHAPQTAELIYYSVEKYPLSTTDIKAALSKWRSHFEIPFDALLNKYPMRVGGWHKLEISPRLTLVLIFDEALTAFQNLPHTIDAFYLDGFAPSKNPEMWTDRLFQAMAEKSHSGTTCSSFTAAGSVKRGLSEAGFHIEKTSGFGRKRDMITGHFKSLTESKTYSQKPQSIAIIGAGLSGAMLSHALEKDGHEVTIFEDHKIAHGASGNDIGLYNPRFTSERNAIGDFYSTAYTTAYRFFQTIDDIDFNPRGAFHLITDEDKQKRFQNCLTSWNWHKDHADIVTPQEIKTLTNIEQNHHALWLKQSGSVSPLKLCHGLLKHKKIIFENPSSFDEFDSVIYAGGAFGKNLPLISSLPIQSIRGQITYAESSHKDLNDIFCYGGYIAPMGNNKYVIGSTFQPWLTESTSVPQDNDDNIQKAITALPNLKNNLTVISDRASFRAASPDRLPIVGTIPHSQNHYVSSAHGSHGLISAHLSAEILKDRLCNRPASIGTHILSALDPIRFEMRNKKK